MFVFWVVVSTCLAWDSLLVFGLDLRTVKSLPQSSVDRNTEIYPSKANWAIRPKVPVAVSQRSLGLRHAIDRTKLQDMIWSRFDRSNCSEKLLDKHLLCLCLSRFFLKGNYAQVERYWSTTMRTFLIKNFTVSLGDNHETYVDSNLLYKNQLILPSYTYRWGRLNPKENHHSSLSLSSVLSPIGRVLLRLHLLKGVHKFCWPLPWSPSPTWWKRVN